ncbi:serine hydrolase domain-containing protein [Verrucomicrobium spinosum]|uniref:serine hydrolase domain-containing protein n=1 Tax=Verrucomicrobium spinosum TaxID=2736 RepID=UPI0001744DC7|nr:serine hydrolase domain-containing protein [Verrucomicrobium spinosum]
MKFVDATAFFCMAMTALPVAAKEIHEAARIGDLTQLERLLTEGHAADEPEDSLGVTAWQIASYHGRKEALDLLAKAGADVQRPFPDPQEIVDRVLSPAVKKNGPGFALLAARDGKVLYAKGYGLADLEKGVPITPDTVFRIGSVTKQFTAAAVLLCLEDGLLRLSDPLTKYFSGYLDGDKITLAHLLSHRSGIRNFTSFPAFSEQVTGPRTPGQVIATFRDMSLESEPGTRYAYCNSSYFLLAEIVKRASGEKYDDLLERRVFRSAHMFSTGVHRPELALQGEALGYARGEDGKGGWRRALDWHMSQAGGAGEFYSTVGDLYRWNEAVFNGKVLSPESLSMAHRPAAPHAEVSAEMTGLAAKYGYGWVADEERGLPKIWHTGGLPGFSSILVRYPAQNFTVVVLSNTLESIDGQTASALAAVVARQHLWREMGGQPCFRELPVPEGVRLADYAAPFDFGGLGVLRFRVKDGRLESKLAAQSWGAVRYHGEDEFRNDGVDATFTFRRDEKGMVNYVKLLQRGSTLEGERFDEPETGKLSREALDAVAGHYELPFGQIHFRVDNKSGELRGRVKGQQEFSYYPVKGDDGRFMCKAVRVQVMFLRPDGAKDGPATGLIIQQGGGMVPGRKVSVSGER